MLSINVTSFYQFAPLSERKVCSLQKKLRAIGTRRNIQGLVILATEGINGTIAGEPDAIAVFKEALLPHFPAILFKDNEAKEQPFKRWFVKIRAEIVSLKNPDIVPKGSHNHLTPIEWNRVLDEEDVVVLDIRNTYETEIGMFEGAIDPGLRSFQDFPEYVARADIPKDKKILMYCTGGIRCEKALEEMQHQGYQHVYQLSGGILKYLEEYPHQKYKGECFIFDHRVAVDQDLKPTSHFHLCPHCGDPGDVHITCKKCQEGGVICHRCKKEPHFITCSKNCAYILKRKVET